MKFYSSKRFIDAFPRKKTVVSIPASTDTRFPREKGKETTAGWFRGAQACFRNMDVEVRKLIIGKQIIDYRVHYLPPFDVSSTNTS